MQRRPTWLPTLAAMFFFALMLALGDWQLDRAEYKRGLQARFDLGERTALHTLSLNDVAAGDGAALYRRVQLQGHFDAAHQIYLDNRLRNGRAGYEVITPFVLDSGGVVLVNRGWLAWPDRRTSPDARPPETRLELEGVLLRAQQRYFELSTHTVAGTVWQNLDLARFRELTGQPLPDILVQQHSATDDGLLRQWPRPDYGVSTHEGYALQWFALSATIAALYLGFYFRRKTPRTSSS